MEQTFPAGATQRIVIADVAGDLKVQGWDQQSIKVSTDAHIDILQLEGDALIISGCKDDLALAVPYEAIISARNIKHDVSIENVRQATLQDISSDLRVAKVTTVHIEGNIKGDVMLVEASQVNGGSVNGDLRLQSIGEASIGHVGKDLTVREVSRLQARSVGHDCDVHNSAYLEMVIGSVGKDLQIDGAQSVQAANIGHDCSLRDIQGDIKISHIGADVDIRGVGGNVQVGNSGADLHLQNVGGNVILGHIGRDGQIRTVGGNVQTGNIGADAHIEGVHGNITIGKIGKDVRIQADFPPTSMTQVHASGDAAIVLPANADMTIHATVGGNVNGCSVVSHTRGSRVTLIYGNGAARLELHVGGDLNLLGEASPKSSSSAWDWHWNQFSQDMAEFGREMGQFGQELSWEINEVVNEATSSASMRAARVAEKQRRKAEEQRRKAEQQAQRASERAARLNVRINNREWHMDSERVERIVEQARQAAAEGVSGALEAVEQALKNLSVPQPPVPPRPPEPAQQEVPGEYPESEPGETASGIEEIETPATGEPVPTANPEQEREAILRMIAEGRITPEEGDMLLEALGG